MSRTPRPDECHEFRLDSDPPFSSSPAFGTPVHPFRKANPNPAPTRSSVLPILLPPSTLRPVAFRTFTRKHNLTISSSALQTLASFVGKNCGSGWREEGLAERVLDEVAKSWRKAGGGVIVEEGKGASLKAILQALEGNMSGGRVFFTKTNAVKQQASMRVPCQNLDTRRSNLESPASPALAEEEHDDLDSSLHPRNWIKVVEAFDMPRLTYNVDKKYFEITKSKATLFPQALHKTNVFRDRYNIIHQRLLRNESFQTSSNHSIGPSLQRSSSSFAPSQSYRLTPIANLLGRSGTSHLLLGLLALSPAGDLSLIDLTGSVSLDLNHARTIPEDGAWFAPGMIVLVDGIYEEEGNVRGSILGGNSGVGGAIGGRFVGVSICGPPCERRESSLGTSQQHNNGEISSSGGLGWVDFLGVGSERAQGLRMRSIESRCLQTGHNSTESSTRIKMAIMSEVNLDSSKTLDALRMIFSSYCELPPNERPLAFVFIGNFVQNAVINGGGYAGSIEYKEFFDSLSVVLADFPDLLRHSTFVFVPGDNDPWSSAFSGGAASTVPRQPVPEMFTSRVKRAFATANSEPGRSGVAEPAGEAIWTSNPSRLTLFGPVHDIAIFRDDITGRLRRSAVTTMRATDELETVMLEQSTNLENEDEPVPSRTEDQARAPAADAKARASSPSIHAARKLVKTILDQGTMSPFPLSLRPVLWDYAASLQLYPLPTALILADSEAAAFCITYEGCHVMNPGKFIPEAGSNFVKWIEFDVLKNRGRVREERF
ncbi:DNA polymerase epsilon noncatalytic subunit [Aspergillus clavatus NRRL 1]|uniref:DNA polymerase epsilon subunit B n=1 Tax=Aspergillus clavatus (strain ATCC 1007 / CBS 513.65 / DSM 816 / NCTC 3887 / NRRL 1 / QM 1276 / 107) TaxID=344612 RepID=A1C5W5_ASPCL|nr:DNA polymerase epsilon subunit B, putative [Aspergillus clavatus NRRL 1]EAW13786.1 DNA polymerase epsilon subunit B, putative [Aspergillus clavatus NRRL 1]